MSNTKSTTAKSNGEAKKQTATAQPKVEPQAPKFITLQKIEQRNEFLNSLFNKNKRSRLLDAKLKLEKFHLASDDFSVSVRFTDNGGNSFGTSHRETIEKMIKTVLDGITTSLMEVEAHIKAIFE